MKHTVLRNLPSFFHGSTLVYGQGLTYFASAKRCHLRMNCSPLVGMKNQLPTSGERYVRGKVGSF
ncbi:hypothetical protein HMPREF3198_00533 [Winkia neuii]|nr:hypothetical protein HMPREF3198_00533 [Winkia neuii]